MICLVYIVKPNQTIYRPGHCSADFYFDAESFEAAAFAAYHYNEAYPKALCVIDEATQKFRVYRANKGFVSEDTSNSLGILIKYLQTANSRPKRLQSKIG